MADDLALVEDRQGSCMVCGRQRKFKAFAMEHPSLGVCYACHDASDSVRDLQKGNGVIAERIERVRDDLDVAINGLSNADPRRKVLLRADASLRQLKKDMGFPNAGLGGRVVTPQLFCHCGHLMDLHIDESCKYPNCQCVTAGVVPEVKP